MFTNASKQKIVSKKQKLSYNEAENMKGKKHVVKRVKNVFKSF